VRIKILPNALGEAIMLPPHEKDDFRIIQKVLKADPFTGSEIIDDVVVSTMRVTELRALCPDVRRAKTEEMKNRVLYFVDERHDVVVIVAVLPRKFAYVRRDRVVAEIRFYYESEGWKYDCH
jgi:mRNA-degrading endonuclease RelE of RelBE toxin-antitoxin system